MNPAPVLQHTTTCMNTPCTCQMAKVTHDLQSSVIALLDEVCEVALPTIVPIEVHCHEHSGSTHLVRALAAKTRDLVIGIHLVELQHCKLDLLALVLDLLWLCVCLLLAFLWPTREPRREEEG